MSYYHNREHPEFLRADAEEARLMDRSAELKARAERWERERRAKMRVLAALLTGGIWCALVFWMLPNLGSALAGWLDEIPGTGASAIMWVVPSALLTALLIWSAREFLDP